MYESQEHYDYEMAQQAEAENYAAAMQEEANALAEEEYRAEQQRRQYAEEEIADINNRIEALLDQVEDLKSRRAEVFRNLY